MKLRDPHEDDQKMAQNAYEILETLASKYPYIDANQWHAANITALIEGFLDSGIPYEFFCEEMDRIKEFYKHRWEE